MKCYQKKHYDNTEMTIEKFEYIIVCFHKLYFTDFNNIIADLI